MTKNRSGETDFGVNALPTAGDTIRSSREIADVIKRGRRVAGKHVSFVYLRQTQHRLVTAAFVATKRLRNAVDRNRLKRLMRETFRLNLSNLEEVLRRNKIGLKIVVVGSHKLQTLSLKDIEEDFKEFLRKIDKEVAE